MRSWVACPRRRCVGIIPPSAPHAQPKAGLGMPPTVTHYTAFLACVGAANRYNRSALAGRRLTSGPPEESGQGMTRRLQSSGMVLAALAAAIAVAGCRAAPVRQERRIGSEVLGALTPDGLRQAYHTPAFVVRQTDGDRRVVVQDADMAADSQIDDTNLLIWVEGSGDSIEGFRWTAGLLAASPAAFPTHPDRLVIIVLKWSQSSNAVIEHLNHAAQLAGASVLADMLEAHRLRHGPKGHVSLVGFSAGTRVIQLAYAAAVANQGEDSHAEALALVDNIAFIGSSIGYEEVVPFDSIRGRFINFVNPRDTHFGDRAAFVAPAGGKANPLKLLEQATIQRRPRFGASVTGFLRLPMLTAENQFQAVEALERSSASPTVRQAFKMINVPVPVALVAYSLFGEPLQDDDLDDYLNLAPNHYIMTGRGAGGKTDVPSFKQYHETAEEFVRDFLAVAVLEGRLNRFDLQTTGKGASPIGGVPTLVPWAIFAPDKEPPAGGDSGQPATEPKPPAPAAASPTGTATPAASGSSAP